MTVMLFLLLWCVHNGIYVNSHELVHALEMGTVEVLAFVTHEVLDVFAYEFAKDEFRRVHDYVFVGNVFHWRQPNLQEDVFNNGGDQLQLMLLGSGVRSNNSYEFIDNVFGFLIGSHSSASLGHAGFHEVRQARHDHHTDVEYDGC